MDEKVLQAALAGLWQGVEAFASVSGHSPKTTMTFDEITLARRDVARRLAAGNKSDGVSGSVLVSVFSRLDGYQKTQYVPVGRLTPTVKGR
jgi:hypothetical protein